MHHRHIDMSFCRGFDTSSDDSRFLHWERPEQPVFETLTPLAFDAGLTSKNKIAMSSISAEFGRENQIDRALRFLELAITIYATELVAHPNR